MTLHPLNLLLRFVLEMVALAAPGYWAWRNFSGWTALVTTFLLPICIAVVWGVFAVPNDPSRSGKTVVPTKGSIRLVIELVAFTLAVASLWSSRPFFSIGFSVLVIAHYMLSFDRIRWLLKGENNSTIKK